MVMYKAHVPALYVLPKVRICGSMKGGEILYPGMVRA